MAAAAAQEMTVSNIIPQHLESLLAKLEEMGVDMDVDVDRVTIRGGKPLKGAAIKTLPYPGFATDLQQPLTTLMTQAEGESKVIETIYPERFKNCFELAGMGADIEVGTSNCTVRGKTPLTGKCVTATDLRCGAALVVAGLIASGTTEIQEVYHIDRGYCDLDGKLKKLGAKIWREQTE